MGRTQEGGHTGGRGPSGGSTRTMRSWEAVRASTRATSHPRSRSVASVSDCSIRSSVTFSDFVAVLGRLRHHPRTFVLPERL